MGDENNSKENYQAAALVRISIAFETIGFYIMVGLIFIGIVLASGAMQFGLCALGIIFIYTAADSISKTKNPSEWLSELVGKTDEKNTSEAKTKSS